MILGFKTQIKGKPTNFVKKILEGKKTTTIREDAKNRWNVGQKIQLATGVRTKKYEQFAEGECTKIEFINIQYYEAWEGTVLGLFPRVYVNMKLLDEEKIEALAQADGFDTAEDFFKWFNDDFSGKIIHFDVKGVVIDKLDLSKLIARHEDLSFHGKEIDHNSLSRLYEKHPELANEENVEKKMSFSKFISGLNDIEYLRQTIPDFKFGETLLEKNMDYEAKKRKGQELYYAIQGIVLLYLKNLKDIHKNMTIDFFISRASHHALRLYLCDLELSYMQMHNTIDEVKLQIFDVLCYVHSTDVRETHKLFFKHTNLYQAL